MSSESVSAHLQSMEPLWSPVVATGGNSSQIGRPRKPRKQAETVAVGCDQLPQQAHGKEGVDGSSPSEGFSEAPAQQLISLSLRKTFRNGDVHETSTAPNVSELAMLQPLSPSGLAGPAARSS